MSPYNINVGSNFEVIDLGPYILKSVAGITRRNPIKKHHLRIGYNCRNTILGPINPRRTLELKIDLELGHVNLSGLSGEHIPSLSICQLMIATDTTQLINDVNSCPLNMDLGGTFV